MTVLAAAVLFPEETRALLRAMARRPRRELGPSASLDDGGQRTIAAGVSYLPPRASVTR